MVHEFSHATSNSSLTATKQTVCGSPNFRCLSAEKGSEGDVHSKAEVERSIEDTIEHVRKEWDICTHHDNKAQYRQKSNNYFSGRSMHSSVEKRKDCGEEHASSSTPRRQLGNGPKDKFMCSSSMGLPETITLMKLFGKELLSPILWYSVYWVRSRNPVCHDFPYAEDADEDLVDRSWTRRRGKAAKVWLGLLAEALLAHRNLTWLLKEEFSHGGIRGHFGSGYLDKASFWLWKILMASECFEPALETLAHSSWYLSLPLPLISAEPVSLRHPYWFIIQKLELIKFLLRLVLLFRGVARWRLLQRHGNMEGIKGEMGSFPDIRRGGCRWNGQHIIRRMELLMLHCGGTFLATPAGEVSAEDGRRQGLYPLRDRGHRRFAHEYMAKTSGRSVDERMLSTNGRGENLSKGNSPLISSRLSKNGGRAQTLKTFHMKRQPGDSTADNGISVEHFVRGKRTGRIVGSMMHVSRRGRGDDTDRGPFWNESCTNVLPPRIFSRGVCEARQRNVEILKIVAGEILHSARPFVWATMQRRLAERRLGSMKFCKGTGAGIVVDVRAAHPCDQFFVKLYPLLLTLALDLFSIMLTNSALYHDYPSSATIREIGRRKRRLCLYLLRSPAWDWITGPVAKLSASIVSRVVPIFGSKISLSFLTYLEYWRRNHYLLEGNRDWREW